MLLFDLHNDDNNPIPYYCPDSFYLNRLVKQPAVPSLSGRPNILDLSPKKRGIYLARL